MSNNPRDRWSKKWALITGASAGIGLEIARQLAAGGANLVLTARRTDRLKSIAEELASKHHIHAETFSADLVRPQAPNEIFEFTMSKKLEIELLVNNAGFGVFGPTQELEPARLAEMVQVNCSAVVALARLYLPGMVERRHGDILIVSSVAAFQPVPYIAAYAATKAFDLLFAEGLAEEVRDYGVRVCALCPGSTTTEFQHVAQQPDRTFRFPEAAEKVARVGLRGMARGKVTVISGLRNWLMVETERLAPRRFTASMANRVMRPEKPKRS